jgi:hypothetical protein
MGSTRDWLAEWRERQAREKKESIENLWPALEEAGVHMAVVEYSGYGDSGSIEGVHFTPLPQGENRAYNAVENFVYAHLPDGWEINEGSDGEVTIDVPGRTASFEHDQNVHVKQRESYKVVG